MKYKPVMTRSHDDEDTDDDDDDDDITSEDNLNAPNIIDQQQE